MQTKLVSAFLRTVIAVVFLSGAAHAADPHTPGFAAQSQMSEEIAKRYFSAYINKDWNTLESLLADDSSFEDPTARLVFGPVLQQGKAPMMKNFRDNYAPVSMHFNLQREMFAGDYAIFEGELNWTYQMPARKIVTEKMPMVVILKVENGRVVSHRDYADYRPYIDAERRSRKVQAEPKS